MQMGKFAKAILIFFSSLLIIIVTAVAIIPLFVDLNDYKSEIEAAVKDKIGRTLTITGDLDISVFPWLGISTGEISLSNATGFADKNFVLIGESDIKVKLIPLFSRKVEVRTVVLKGLELNLAKNKQGISNWNDLVKPKENKDQQETTIEEEKDNKTESLLAAFAIGGLALKDSRISWNDQQSGQHIVIKDFNFSSGAVAFNEPIDLKLSFLLENAEPAVIEHLALSTNLIIDEALQKIQLKNFQLDSTTEGESIPSGTLDAQLLSEITLDLQQQTLALEKIQFNSNTIDLTGYLNASQLNTQLQYSGAIQIATFSPKALMQQLEMDVPETADSLVLQQLAIDFVLQGTKDTITLNALKITLDDTQILGDISIKRFKKPAIAFNLAVDSIDVDRYSAPKQEGAAPVPATPAAAVTKATTLIPVETIRSLDLSGDLSIDHLKAANLSMKGISLNLKAKKGILRTRQSIKHLYKGRYKGNTKINAKSKIPTLAFNEKISGVQLEPLLKDLRPESAVKLKGTANIAAKLKARGNTMPAIKSSLRGTLRFSLHKGAIRDFNLQKIIDVGKLAIKGKEMKKSYANEQTVFSVIKGTATIKKGLINNPDFLAESSTVEVKGAGTASLVSDALNYQVIAKVKQGKNKKSSRIAGRPIAIKVAGTISEPTYKVDLSSLESMMTKKEKKKVDKFINKREKDIDKALGKGTGKAVNKLLQSFF